MDWFQIRKGGHQGLSPCLFNLHAEYIMQNARLYEAQAGIKSARRNINNLRYADDTTLTAESENELKSLLMEMKEEGEKVGFKLNIQKPKIMASSPITSWQLDGETMEIMTDFIFLAPKSLWMVTAAMKLKMLYNKPTATAKSLQSCPTLFDPRDGSPPGSAVPGTLQARTLEWVAISFSNA